MHQVTAPNPFPAIGPAIRGNLLEMHPLLADDDHEPAYDLAGLAFLARTLEVTEVSDTGSVPRLRARNVGRRPVLLLDGEELIGAKQNRVLNLTVMVPAGAIVDLPVSCVEAGRWGYRSRAFRDAPWLMDGEGRARKMRRVSESMRRGSRDGDQHDVWDHIAAKAARMRAASDTGAQAAMFERHGAPLDQEADLLRPVPFQVGALFAAGGRFCGLERFDAPSTLRAVLPKLVRSHALDALDRRRQRRRGFRSDEPEDFLAAVERMERREHPAVGCGTEVRLEGRGLVGAGLIVDGRTVHLCVLAG